MHSRNVAIVGLGYVGLTLAVAMAQRGMTVYGIERRREVVDLTNAGQPHFSEEGLADVLAAVVERGHLRAATAFADVPPCDSYVITVGTPLDAEGTPRLDMVRHATAEVASHMAGDALVVLRSTVQIGTTRDVVARVLQEAGKRGLVAMCPERTLEGDALREIGTLPQIVGGLTEEATAEAADLFGALTNSVIRVSTPETAEMIKLVDNTFRDVRFAFANEVARACDAVGVHAAEVIGAGKLGYPRTNVAWPGLVGGPCLEKDPHILRHSLSRQGIDLEITGAARRVNERQPEETVGHAFALFERRAGRPPAAVALAGLAFKGVPETDDLRGSMALAVIGAIRARGYAGPIRVFDPAVTLDAVSALDQGLQPHDSLTAATAGADILFIANNHPEYRRTTFERIVGELSADGFVYDYWNHFGHESGTVLKDRYFTVGGLVGEAGMKVAVTGAAGFIGAYLSRRLADDGNDVVAIDNFLRGEPDRIARHPGIQTTRCDVRDVDALTATLEGVEVVYHLAAINGTGNFYNRPELVLDVGVRGALAVIEAARRARTPDLVIASSAEVYQTPAVVPTDETTAMVIPDPLNPRYSYGGSKLISELIAFNYGQDVFRRVQVFRPHNVYGPDMGWKHVIPQLIGKAQAAVAAGEDTIEIQGDGSEARAFCYVDDIVDGIVTMQGHGEHRQVYHIGSMEEVSVRDLVGRITAELGLALQVRPGPAMAGGTPRRCPDITKMRAIGYEPKVSLDDGLRRTVAWYAEHAPRGENALL